MVVMLISGALNTLLMKLQVLQTVPEKPGGIPDQFDHPYFQTFLMMIGELMCLGVFYLFFNQAAQAKITYQQKLLFAVPVFCDMTATTLVNYAFLMIPASVVQMTRGAIVLFTCFFSVVLLGRRLEMFHYLGVALVSGGITLVSLTAIIYPAHENSDIGSPIMGIFLCFLAQAFQASQLVSEEKFLGTLRVDPMLAIGLEGFVGVVVMSFVMPVASYAGQENIGGAMYQMSQNMTLLVAVILSVFSIAFFNWSGITVTKNASAVARSTIDCSRTILVWMVELMARWNDFHLLQLAGFLLLALGTMLYNELIPVPSLLRNKEAMIDEKSRLIKKLKDLEDSESTRDKSSPDPSDTEYGAITHKSKKQQLV